MKIDTTISGIPCIVELTDYYAGRPETHLEPEEPEEQPPPIGIGIDFLTSSTIDFTGLNLETANLMPDMLTTDTVLLSGSSFNMNTGSSLDLYVHTNLVDFEGI